MCDVTSYRFIIIVFYILVVFLLFFTSWYKIFRISTDLLVELYWRVIKFRKRRRAPLRPRPRPRLGPAGYSDIAWLSIKWSEAGRGRGRSGAPCYLCYVGWVLRERGAGAGGATRRPPPPPRAPDGKGAVKLLPDGACVYLRRIYIISIVFLKCNILYAYLFL